MASTGLQIFTSLLLVQMFYALGVTLLVPLIPGVAANQVLMYSTGDSVVNFTTLSNSLHSGITSQQSIPLLSLGTLIFYSANIILNLMINFFTAIPQMLTIFISGLFLLIPISQTVQLTVKMVFITIVSVIYFIALFSFIMGAVTGRVVQ